TAEYAPASAALHVADGPRWPLLARFGRIHPPDRPAHRGRLRTSLERYRGKFPARSRGPRHEGLRDSRYLEQYHAELAGRRRRSFAGRIVGAADLRFDAEFRGLSRFWRVPRSRRPGAAGCTAPLRVLR